ncbi:MAG TPA: hypothetical protein VK489_10515 [Ferruginibacter sp.]|nr:hypothetical protein [Ferruginibacter sp.]
MMKRIKLLIVIFAANIVHAQNKNFNAPVSDLYIPDVPGFVLSDKAPASVDKPSNPRAFGVSLLNLRNGGAVEVTPFWLVSNPNFTFEKWVKNKFPVIETCNLSGTTFKTDSSSVLSVGARSQLVRVYSKTTLKDIFDKKAEIVKLLIPKLDSNDEPVDMTYADSIAVFRKLDEIAELKKKGFFAVELAGAIIGSSKNNSFKQLSSERSGVWVNLRWSPIIVPVNITAVARYSWANNTNPKIGKDSSFLDFGGSLNYEFKKLSLAAEYVYRKDISLDKNYARFSFVGNYAITENIILVSSIGKNFSNVDDMITVIGVKFAVSRAKLSL